MDESYNYLANPELARDTFWICNILFSKINPELKHRDMSFNLTNFTLPEQNISTTTLSHQGSNIPIPGRVRSTNKVLTLDYLMDAEFKSFKFMWNWTKLMANEIGSGVPSEFGGITENVVVPADIMLLSSFKKPIMTFRFENAWISRIGELSCAYQSDSSPITHAFDISYSHLILED